MNPSTPERKIVIVEEITWAPKRVDKSKKKIMEKDLPRVNLFPSIPSQNSAFRLNAPKKAVQPSTEKYDLGEFTPTSLKF